MVSGVFDIIPLGTNAQVLLKRFEDVVNAPARLEAIKNLTKTTNLIISLFDSAYNEFKDGAGADDILYQDKGTKETDLVEDLVTQYNDAIKKAQHVVDLVIEKDGRFLDRLKVKILVAKNKHLLEAICQTIQILLSQMTAVVCICCLHKENMNVASIREQDSGASIPAECLNRIKNLEIQLECQREQASADYRKLFRLVRKHNLAMGPSKKDMKKLRQIGEKINRTATAVVGEVETPEEDRRRGGSRRSASKSHRPTTGRGLPRSSVYSFEGTELFKARDVSNDLSTPQESPRRRSSTRSTAVSTAASSSIVGNSSTISLVLSIPSSRTKSDSFDPLMSGELTQSSPKDGSAVSDTKSECAGTVEPMDVPYGRIFGISEARSPNSPPNNNDIESAAEDAPARAALRKELREKTKHCTMSEESVVQRKRIRNRIRTGSSAMPVAPFTPSDAGFPEDK